MGVDDVEEDLVIPDAVVGLPKEKLEIEAEVGAAADPDPPESPSLPPETASPLCRLRRIKFMVPFFSRTLRNL